MGLRLPDTEHTRRPWRIHALTTDFAVEDVWALPATGEREDFPALVQGFAAGDPARGPAAMRWLFAVRWWLGERLGWDDPTTGTGARVPTLSDRLPPDLRGTAVPEFSGLPFAPLYLLGDEFAAEIANRTMHGVMHLGWVPDGHGGYRGQMAVLVKPNGAFGRAYMAAIRPFRHLIVYPQMMGMVEREFAGRRRALRDSRPSPRAA